MKRTDDNSFAEPRPNPTAWLLPTRGGVEGMPFWVRQRLERVRERAGKLREARGGASGAELQDWLQAEREIGGED